MDEFHHDGGEYGRGGDFYGHEPQGGSYRQPQQRTPFEEAFSGEMSGGAAAAGGGFDFQGGFQGEFDFQGGFQPQQPPPFEPQGFYGGNPEPYFDTSPGPDTSTGPYSYGEQHNGPFNDGYAQAPFNPQEMRGGPHSGPHQEFFSDLEEQERSFRREEAWQGYQQAKQQRGGGYDAQQQPGGGNYDEQQQSGGYGSQQQSGGFSSQPQRGGYGSQQQRGGYGAQQQQRGYSAQQQHHQETRLHSHPSSKVSGSDAGNYNENAYGSHSRRSAYTDTAGAGNPFSRRSTGCRSFEPLFSGGRAGGGSPSDNLRP